MAKKTIYASLVGINAYEKVNPLNGCINDILGIDKVLREICDQQDSNLEYIPEYFLAPHKFEAQTIKDHFFYFNYLESYHSPSFSNLSTKAFDHLSNASNDDICLFYFSGHGSYINSPIDFSGNKGTHQNETLVAVDSRSGGRSLIDKELAYLIYKTLKTKPKVHCLLIMDCCHSGDNTKASIDSQELTFREVIPDEKSLDIKGYLGYKEGFYTIENGKATYPIARYVHLAACRDHEKAAEVNRGGVFSKAFREMLQLGGSSQTYRSLIKSVSSTISMEYRNQNPIYFSREFEDLDQPFFGGNIKPYRPIYEVQFDGYSENWKLFAGKIQGLVPSGPIGKTIIAIDGENILAEVSEVGNNDSILTGSILSSLIPTQKYRARLVELGLHKFKVGLHSFLLQRSDLLDSINESYKKSKFLYFEFDHGISNPNFKIGLLELDNNLAYSLTLPNDDQPLFKSQKDPYLFLSDIESICKWSFAKNLIPTNPGFNTNDFDFEIEIIEGQKITRDNINELFGDFSKIKPGETKKLYYREENQPAFRFTIKINEDSSLSHCFIQALFFGHNFAVHSNYIKADRSMLSKGQSISLNFNLEARYFNAIPIGLGKNYKNLTINEITDQLKIIVSKNPELDVSSYEQSPLEAADKIRVRSANKKISLKGNGFDDDDETLGKDDWATFDFFLNVIADRKEQKLKGGQPIDFGAFQMMVPSQFEAIVTTITTNDLEVNKRNLDSQIKNEPLGLWGELITGNLPFRDVDGIETDGGVIGIEISVEENKPFPKLQVNQEILLSIKEGFAQSRSMELLDETIIPYSFDLESGFYFPVGYSDCKGNIHINNLPEPTPGFIAPNIITQKSIIGSIKLYFKKIYRKAVTKLTLHYFDHGWKQTDDQKEIKRRIKAVPHKTILPLIIHGIIGDTQSMVKGIQQYVDLHKEYALLLSYDYENLGTKISDTAKILKQSLLDVGYADNSLPKLTIIAHSMGGLLSRWLLEKDKFTAPFERLIMAGTPNGGSEWSDAVSGIKDGASFLISHALNVTGPLKHVITGLSFFLKKLDDPLTTLRDMDHTGDLITELSQGKPPVNVHYFLVGADTSLMREGYNGDDPFLKKASNWLRDGLVMPGLRKTLFNGERNDMAVTNFSMKSIEGFDTENQVIILAGDHISYFSEKETREEILSRLK